MTKGHSGPQAKESQTGAKNATVSQIRWSTTGASLERRGESAWRSGKDNKLEGET